jgi:hypothetical protein
MGNPTHPGTGVKQTMKRTKFARIGAEGIILAFILVLFTGLEIYAGPAGAKGGQGAASVLPVADKGSDFLASKIEISPRVHSLNPCEEKQFGVSVHNALGKTIKDPKVTWESTNPSVAKVGENGVVVGVNPGYTFIRALDGKVKSNVASVFVREKGTRRC